MLSQAIATPNEIGNWLLAGAAVIGILVLIVQLMNQWKQLHAKPVEPIIVREDQPVTRAELDKVEHELSTQLQKHEDYTHTRLHELSDAINAVGMKLAAQPVEMRTMIDHALMPISAKVDRMASVVTAIATKMNVPPLEESP